MRPGDHDWLEDRIRGSIGFAALGDAAGAAAEGWTRAQAANYGDPLRALAGGDAEVTDDTGQLEALARALIACGGELTEEAWRAALLDWFRNSPTAAKAGPTTRAMLEGGPPGDDPRVGLTNGSAMRVAPAGLVNPGDVEGAVELAWLTSVPTHPTQVGGAAAGAIAAGVAAALRPEASAGEVAEACVRGAVHGEGLGVLHGRVVSAPRMSERIELALGEARAAADLDEALERVDAAVGTSVLAFESVPAAVAVFAAAGGDPAACVRAGVRIGGDTDTIAAMAGALAGALTGLADDDRELVALAAPPDLDDLASALAAIAARGR